MGNSSSDRSSGSPGDRDRYREGGKEARAKILLDTAEDGDADPKVRKFTESFFFLKLKLQTSRLAISPDFCFIFSSFCARPLNSMLSV